MTRTHPSGPILPVILAGGEGARLAPISAPEQPKPFVPLPDGHSLLSHTLARVAGPAFLAPVLVGQVAHRFALLNHARAAEVTPAAMLLEPKACNTAMAVAVAVCWARVHQPDAILAILPADHAIEPRARWLEAATQAAALARTHAKLCLLGVPPRRPDPNFGYIRPGAPVPGSAALHVAAFIEKPENPETLLEDCLWNSGQFFVGVAVLEALLAENIPDVWRAACEAYQAAENQWEFTHLGQAAYLQVAPHSFDRAVVEKAPSLVQPLIAAWHDLGTVAAWEAYTCQNMAEMLARPVRTDRPWGYFEVLARNETSIEKRLVLYPGTRISMQRHHARDEQWHVLSGIAEVELEGQRYTLAAGEQITIPAQAWHRLSNHHRHTLIIHEIQSGRPMEDDIERREDDYGRVENSN